jgi:hypothetical protein
MPKHAQDEGSTVTLKAINEAPEAEMERIITKY